jgi:hypothetical protein
VNGYVLAWMAISSGPSAAAGLLLGRKLQHRESYSMGFDAGLTMEQYRKQHPVPASDQLAQMRAASSGHVGGHGHDGPCSPERGCY